jgi:cysteinyl-tRNA synthetase
MMLQLHNTLTQKTEPFSPQSDKKVTLYTCGPTVYNYLHVGNWFGYIMWDVLVRTLKANDLQVERVMNVTDVGHLTGENEGDANKGEDKLEKGARQEGKTAWEVAEFYTRDFLEGMKKLGLVAPEHITKATDYIPQQLDLVRALKNKGFTYQIDDGIYFDTSKFPTYAEFAHLDLAAQKAGARIEFNPEKRNPSDFALWKFTPEDEARAMEWETPEDLLEQGAGAPTHVMGFPGWHLECSAMAMAILGNTIDIHTGGIDHIPVHHTNEIAQSEAATGKLFSRFWLHNNHIKSNGTKISKSLGNGYTLQDLEARSFSAMDFRMFALQSQYSNESNFTWENLEAAHHRLRHWRNTAALRWQIYDTLRDDEEQSSDERTVYLYAAAQALLEALNDDLNTPAALAIVDDAFSRLTAKPLADIHQQGLEQLLESIDNLLGLQLLMSTPDINDTVKQLILERERARENKDWQRSDELRDTLKQQGIAIRDTAKGSVWEYDK